MRTKSRFIITVLFLTVLGAVLAGNLLAQASKTAQAARVTPADPPLLYVQYLVVFNGDGGIAENTRSTSWHVERSYGGLLTLKRVSAPYVPDSTRRAIANIPKGLLTGPEIDDAIKTAKRQLGSQQWVQVTDADSSTKRPAYIKIKDEFEEVFEDPGGEGGVGKCRSSYKKNWTFDGPAVAGGAAVFSRDPEGYLTIGFAFFPYERADNLTPVKFTAAQTSSGGNCVESESKSESKGFDATEIPNIKYLVQGGSIRTIIPASMVKLDAETWEYTTPAWPAELDMDGFPDSKGNVTGKLWMKISTKPITSKKNTGGNSQ